VEAGCCMLKQQVTATRDAARDASSPACRQQGSARHAASGGI
jgi:hypothetical protein